VNLGGGLIWPNKTKPYEFVHVSERTQEATPEGPRFGLSEALVNTFLPYRQQLMEAFLEERPPFEKHPGPDDLCEEAPQVRGGKTKDDSEPPVCDD
jgi:hypothetical protein